jgi:hypothetical protein
MSTYTYSQLYGPGISGENLSGTVTFEFYNTLTASLSTPYLWDTTPENWNDYLLNWESDNSITTTQSINGVSSYFTLETNRNTNGYYDSTSLLNFEGTYNVPSYMNLVTSSYIAAVVIPPGYSSFTFTPNSPISGSTYSLRGTGMYSLVIS